MTTEIRLGATFPTAPADAEPSSGEIETRRRVLETADDQPSTDSLPALADPAADHFESTIAARRDDVEAKHRLVNQFLDQSGYDGLILSSADSVAWFTSGGDLRQELSTPQSSVQLFINRKSRAVLADNVQSPRVFEEELSGLGFYLKERPWYESAATTLSGLSKSKRLAADIPGLEFPDESVAIQDLRLSLTPLERQRLRELGRTVTNCVEGTCRNFEAGETEADLAGHLAHRLLREGVTPVDLRVASDDRLTRFRQPNFKAASIRNRAIVAATGRRHGLCASVTRIVSIGPVDPRFRDDHALAAMVDATLIYFSRPGQPVNEVFRRARRIYEKFGHPHEWTLDYQGFISGYAARELPLTPDGSFELRPNLPLRWHPSVGSARSEDTVVIDSRGFEVVTEAQRWPKVEVLVKGFVMPRPGILER